MPSKENLPVRMSDARSAVAAWVREHAGTDPGFRGALLAGSTAQLPDDAQVPTGSDIDVMIVTSAGGPQPKLGKFRYQGALLEVSYLTDQQLASPQAVLSSYHVAGVLRTGSVIADPTGDLEALAGAVRREFARRH